MNRFAEYTDRSFKTIPDKADYASLLNSGEPLLDQSWNVSCTVCVCVCVVGDIFILRVLKQTVMSVLSAELAHLSFLTLCF